MDIQDKVRGMFFGIAIGDALGAPAEGFDLQKIRDRFGKLTNYVSCEGHKWLDKLPLGGWTDDTHLTLAVARGLIQDKGFTLPGQVFQHIVAMQKNDTGWGPTTKDAILKLHQGVDPRESGTFKAPDPSGKGARGVGNGIPMKSAPLAAYFHAVGAIGWPFASEGMVSWTAMTHPSSVAVSSCFAHFFTMLYCLQSDPQKFDPKVFVFKAHSGAMNGEKFFPETLTDRLAERMQTLLTPRTEEQIVADFNGGKSYVFDSLPFAYAFFLRDYDSIEAVYNAASAGGDTDTNASIVGGLLGALHGIKVFPAHLIERLHNREEVEAVTSDFITTFFPPLKPARSCVQPCGWYVISFAPGQEPQVLYTFKDVVCEFRKVEDGSALLLRIDPQDYDTFLGLVIGNCHFSTKLYYTAGIVYGPAEEVRPGDRTERGA